MRVNGNSLFGYFLFDLVYTTSDYYTRHPIYSRSRSNKTHITTVQYPSIHIKVYKSLFRVQHVIVTLTRLDE